MSRVEQSIAVRCPLATGHIHLDNWFRAHASPDGERATLALIVTAAIVGLDKPMSVHRSVVATLRKPPATASGDASYRVQWEPETPGPFPVFTGELFLEAVSTRESLSLRLHGVYTPPLAFLGKGHDLIGNRLAVATADELLLRMREFIERDFRIEQTRKKGQRAPERYELPATLD
jgi:hypothetical protein